MQWHVSGKDTGSSPMPLELAEAPCRAPRKARSRRAPRAHSPQSAPRMSVFRGGPGGLIARALRRCELCALCPRWRRCEYTNRATRPGFLFDFRFFLLIREALGRREQLVKY
jgi:hypothetical protein